MKQRVFLLCWNSCYSLLDNTVRVYPNSDCYRGPTSTAVCLILADTVMTCILADAQSDIMSTQNAKRGYNKWNIVKRIRGT